MTFEETLIQDVLVVRVNESRIVADVVPQFREGLIAFVERSKSNIVLDLSNVTFIDSSGLGALIGCLKAMDRGSELVLSGARDSVMSMFKLTRMDKVFRTYETPEVAVGALA